ncbi:MAG: tetratricopeptide repeat protein [Propioniciclava sp.]|uniref:tetratricopeptide repeat protein n=1 Tax=Propioniciclava sp. TaxID=2038686 RepID=UPI0039E63EBD
MARSSKSSWWVLAGYAIGVVLFLGLGSVSLGAEWTVPEGWPLAGTSVTLALFAAAAIPFALGLLQAGVTRRRDRAEAAAQAIKDFRSHLHPLSASFHPQPRADSAAPRPARDPNVRADGVRPDDDAQRAKIDLDQALYRLAPYWGRSTLHHQLDEARAHPGVNVVLLTGAVWTGKTRLLTEWASGVAEKEDVIAGWLPGSADTGNAPIAAIVNEAIALDRPVVLLQQGSDADAVAALSALANTTAPVTLVIERRSAAPLRERAERASPAVQHLLDGAHTITIASPGSPSDFEHRYGEMVHAYLNAVNGKPATGPRPRSMRTWSNEPIGLVSALAMIHALEGPSSTKLSTRESLAHYWVRLTQDWRKAPQPDSGYGLPKLSPQQLEDALALTAIIGDATEALHPNKHTKELAKLGWFEDLTTHQAQQLASWARETLSTPASLSATLAAIAAAEAWTPERIRALGTAIRSGSERGLIEAIRQCVIAGEFFGAPRLLSCLTPSTGKQIRSLVSLVGETSDTSRFDLFLIGVINSARESLSAKQVNRLLEMAMLDRLPRSHIALLELQLEFTPEEQTEDRASRTYDLSIRLSYLGEYRQALPHAQEAVNLHRDLADDNPTRHNPNLANSLTNLSNRLGNLGEYRQALPHIQEAVNLHRDLADDNPTRHNPNLANSLTNLSNCLGNLGEYRQALPHAQEAVNLHRDLADDNPTRHNPNLANSLTNLSNRLGNLGEYRQALPHAQEAVNLHRDLADDNPTRHNPDLANSLTNLSNHLFYLGEHRQALPHIQEAVNLYRDLADDNPTRHNPNLANSLTNLSNHLFYLGEHRQALPHIQEAVNLYRDLADDNPTRHNPNLANSLNTLSNHLFYLGEHRQALPHIQEAVNLHRALADDNPTRHNPNLANSLNTLSNHLFYLGEHRQALPHIQEAVNLHRDLADDNPTRHNPNLANSLHNLSNRLGNLGEYRQALPHAQEAVNLHRDLADDNPTRHNPNLANSLTNLSNRLANLGEYRQALVAAEEALTLYQILANEDVARFGSSFKKAERRADDLRQKLRETEDDSDPADDGP